MSGLFSLWLCTVATSTGIEVANVLKLYKEAADRGLRIDGEKFKNSNISLLLEKGNSVKSLFVPAVNIKKSIEERDEVNDSITELLSYLVLTGSLVRFTPEEIELYKKNPSALTALKISSNYSNPRVITLKDGSTIKYKLIGDNCSILSVKGKVRTKTSEELDSIIKEDITSNILIPLLKQISSRKTKEEGLSRKISEIQEYLNRYLSKFGLTKNAEELSKLTAELYVKSIDKATTIKDGIVKRFIQNSKGQ